MKRRRQIFMICKEIYCNYVIQIAWCFFHLVITGSLIKWLAVTVEVFKKNSEFQKYSLQYYKLPG